MVTVAYTVGRFQPPTIGHRMLIEKTIAEAKGGNAYVFVSSTQGSKKDAAKNPLTSKQKLPLLKKMFPSGVTFVDTAECNPKCGGPTAAFEWLLRQGHKPEEITFVIGKERLGEDTTAKEYFGPEAAMWGDAKPARFVPVGLTTDRDIDAPASDQNNMSGTKARGYVTEDNSQKANFYTAVGAVYNAKKPDPDVEAVYSRIYEVKFGKKGGRRTRRIKRSKASGKALYHRGLRLRNGSSKTSRS